MKAQLIELVRAEGYDFVTAAGLVSQCLAEFKASGKRRATYHIGRSSFTVENARGTK